jgi:hypothetical protein
LISLGNGFARSEFEARERKAAEAFQHAQREAAERLHLEDRQRQENAAKQLEIFRSDLSRQLQERQKTFELALARAFDDRKTFDENLRLLDEALQRALKPLWLIVSSSDVWDDDTMLQNASEAFQTVGALFSAESAARKLFARWKRDELVETCRELRREFTDCVLALAKTKEERGLRRTELLDDFQKLVGLHNRVRDAIAPTIQEAIARVDNEAFSHVDGRQ